MGWDKILETFQGISADMQEARAWGEALVEEVGEGVCVLENEWGVVEKGGRVGSDEATSCVILFLANASHTVLCAHFTGPCVHSSEEFG